MSDGKGILRKDAPQEGMWSGDKIFPTWAEWQAAFEGLDQELEGLKSFEGSLMSSPEKLAEWLDLMDDLTQRANQLTSFARFAATVDGTDVDAKTAVGQGAGLQSRLAAATSFSLPEMLAEPDKLRAWAETEPGLKLYRHYFDNQIRQKAFLRSPEVEEVLSRMREPFEGVYQTFGELVNTDLQFEDAISEDGSRHTIRQSTLQSSLQSLDRARRKSAWENYQGGYVEMQNTLAANYLTWVKQQVFLAQTRGYDSVLEMRLSPFHVPLEMFHNLIDTFVDKLPVWQRYWDVRRKAMGLEEVYPYDLWAPVGKNPPVIPYPQAVAWIAEALEPMGEEYVGPTRRGALEDRWVDWVPNVEKRQGAASWRRFRQPPWIFMSYNESIFSLSTLAHELGHSIHTYLASENQPEVYFGYGSLSSTVTETASNFNQVLTRAYLRDLKGDDPDFIGAMVEETMANFHRYFFIMPTLARFELEVFRRAEAGERLNVEVFNELMADLFAEGYGETMQFDRELVGITWATFLHLYMPFYTFQYSIGISAAHAAGEKILAGDEAAIENYLQFLKAGGSMYTMELFNLIGVDMSTPAPVLSAFRVMEENIDLMARLG